MTKFASCAFVCLALTISSFADSINGRDYTPGSLYNMLKGTELCSTEGDCMLYNHYLTTGDKQGMGTLESSGHVTYLSKDTLVYLQFLLDDQIANVQIPGQGSAYTFSFELFDPDRK
jgi:hypothetical protein